MLTILLASYGAVFVAELVGDKTLYTIVALVSRYKPLPVLAGVGAAFMGKMAVAVLVGGLVASLPRWATAVLSGVTFLSMAAFLSWDAARPTPSRELRRPGSAYAALVGFASIFFTEWGDIGQITAALLAARHGRPGVVWVGATAALVTKAILATTLGMGVRRWAPRKLVRITAVCLLALMGALALLRID